MRGLAACRHGSGPLRQPTVKHRNPLKEYRRTVAEIERIAHRGRPPVATGQTIARLTESPLAYLKRRKVFNVWEFTAADEIICAHHSVAGIGQSRDASLGIRNQPQIDGADWTAAGRVDAIGKFHEWRIDLRGTDALAVATAILLDERSLRDIDQEFKWRKGTARDHLITAVRHFAALRRNTPRGMRWEYNK